MWLDEKKERRWDEKEREKEAKLYKNGKGKEGQGTR